MLLRTLPDVGGAHGTDLVHPEFRVHHEGVFGSKAAHGLCDATRAGAIGDTNHLTGHSGGIGQWAEQIHHRCDAELFADRPDMTHGGMEIRGEEEGHARMVEQSSRFGQAQQ